ncbi:MAG: hypothetical protein HRT35_01015 [Algicola sp.]|nr:hypothetical protein [Algicola sp.]
MNSNDLKKRLGKERPMTSITLRVPQDVVDDLKRISPQLGFSGYQPLMRAYVGQGLRQDLAKLEGSDINKLVESLKRQGVESSIISQALEEVD